jgi:hypothetical protein
LTGTEADASYALLERHQPSHKRVYCGVVHPSVLIAGDLTCKQGFGMIGTVERVGASSVDGDSSSFGCCVNVLASMQL